MPSLTRRYVPIISVILVTVVVTVVVVIVSGDASPSVQSPTTLVVDLHGAGMNPYSYIAYLPRWPSRYTVPIYPMGTLRKYRDGQVDAVWNAGENRYPPASSLGIDHVYQLNSTILKMREKNPQLTHIVMAGLSNGAAMAQRYAFVHKVDAVVCNSHNIAPFQHEASAPTPFMAFTHRPGQRGFNDTYVAEFEERTIARWKTKNAIALDARPTAVVKLFLAQYEVKICIWEQGRAPIVWIEGPFMHAFHVTRYLYHPNIQHALRSHRNGSLTIPFGDAILLPP